MATFRVYSTRLMAWAASEAVTPFEVPTGCVVVMRDLDVWSGGGAMINWQLAINDVCKITAGQFTVESIAQHAQWSGRQVANAGEFLTFSSDGPTDGALSGYVLTLP